MPIVFDVGANDGSTCIRFAQERPDTVVWAFEPTPKLADELREKTKHMSNYHVVQKAVSDVPGTAKFYVAGTPGCDWGCSSLNQFNDNLEETWPGRPDFKVTDTIEVEVIRLDTFMAENNIVSVDHLHVDVQGKDMEVMMSLGDKLTSVGSGVIEMPLSDDVKLYKDQKYTLVDGVKFLTKNGFRVHRIESNDVFCNEVNIFYYRA